MPKTQVIVHIFGITLYIKAVTKVHPDLLQLYENKSRC